MIKTIPKILVQFTFLFWIIFVVCFNYAAIPFMYYLQNFTAPALHSFISWFAGSFLGIVDPITFSANGSGDTTYDYVLLLVMFLFTIVGTLIWSLLDHKKKCYNQLFYWLTVVLRFYVGLTLCRYGIGKLNNGQFPALSSYRLLSTYGESSPMGLAWSFLSYSRGYQWFMFFAESMSALLFFRRTTTIGAFLSLMTSANIMAINYFFDVPVKILSTGLVIMCLTMLAPNIKQLFLFFFKGETVKLNSLKAPAFKSKSISISKQALKYVLIFKCVGLPLFIALKIALCEQKPSNETIQSFYNIDEITWVKGENKPDNSTLKPNWTAFTFENDNYGIAQSNDNSLSWYKYSFNYALKTIEFSFMDDPKTIYKFNYTIPVQDKLIFKGSISGKQAIIVLTKKRFELTERQFHWINEYPYNK